MARCRHPARSRCVLIADYSDGTSRTVGQSCAACGEWLPCGPANDAPTEVQIEIAAAQLNAYGIADAGLRVQQGWAFHETGDDEPSIVRFIDHARVEYWAGYLARCIAEHKDGEP